jgi:hypothetical protein
LYTHEYLVETVERLRKEGGYKGVMANSYKCGAAVELNRRIEEEMEKRKADLESLTGTDLVVIKKELVEVHFGMQESKVQSRKLVSKEQFDAYKNGKADASKIGLDVQVADKTQRKYIC